MLNYKTKKNNNYCLRQRKIISLWALLVDFPLAEVTETRYRYTPEASGWPAEVQRFQSAV